MTDGLATGGPTPRPAGHRQRPERETAETTRAVASGRRLLGDRSRVGPADGPFARTPGAAA